MSQVLTWIKTGMAQLFTNTALPNYIAAPLPVRDQGYSLTGLSLKWFPINLNATQLTYRYTQQCPEFKNVSTFYLIYFTGT